MGYMAELEREAAESALATWAVERRRSDANRDTLIRMAVAAGVTKHRVHVLTGIARTTIDRIVAGGEGGES